MNLGVAVPSKAVSVQPATAIRTSFLHDAGIRCGETYQSCAWRSSVLSCQGTATVISGPEARRTTQRANTSYFAAIQTWNPTLGMGNERDLDALWLVASCLLELPTCDIDYLYQAMVDDQDWCDAYRRDCTER